MENRTTKCENENIIVRAYSLFGNRWLFISYVMNVYIYGNVMRVFYKALHLIWCWFSVVDLCESALLCRKYNKRDLCSPGNLDFVMEMFKFINLTVGNVKFIDWYTFWYKRNFGGLNKFNFYYWNFLKYYWNDFTFRTILMYLLYQFVKINFNVIFFFRSWPNLISYNPHK